MKSFSGFKDKDKRILRKANRNIIKEQRELYRKGIITKDQFKSAKQEIKNYTDIDVAKDYLFDKGLKPYNESVRRSDKK